MKRSLGFLLLALCLAWAAAAAAAPLRATVEALDDETPAELLRRHGLDSRHARSFLLLNGLPDSDASLRAGAPYRLPVLVRDYAGGGIRTSLHVPMSEAVALREFNAELARTGAKPPISADRKIWMPDNRVLARADAGQRADELLSRYGLGDRHVAAFAQLNDLGAGASSARLEAGRLYRLPVHTESYRGPTIRQALGVSREQAAAIAAYNKKMHERGLKPQVWNDHVVWVPYELGDNALYGPIYREFEVVGDQLAGCVFYLSPGHGGPDPGTLGEREGEDICEDEYVYDITLRLARELESHGARVEVLLKDEGIRDEKFLPADKDEKLQNGRAIPLNKNRRLKQRVDLANRHYARRSGSEKHHRFLSLHIDFRPDADKRVDFDIYHFHASAAGRRLAETLQHPIERSFDLRLGGRDFVGRIKSQTRRQSYYVLRETNMPAVLIELANINNEMDQLKFIVIDSRQRIAEWLCEGLIADRERVRRAR